MRSYISSVRALLVSDRDLRYRVLEIQLLQETLEHSRLQMTMMRSNGAK